MATDDDLTQTRLDVAEMKGMLSQALGDQAQRMRSAEAQIETIHGRLSDHGRQLASHSEKITHTQEDVDDLQEDNDARLGKVVGIVGAIVAVGSLVYTIITNVS